MRAKMDWLRLESRMRETFRQLRASSGNDMNRVTLENALEALTQIADAVGDETGRGYPLEGAIELNGESCPRCDGTQTDPHDGGDCELCE